MDQIPNKYVKPKEEKALEKVVTGDVKVKKRSRGKKFFDLFFNEDWGDIREYVVFEKMVPDIKNTILDIIEMIFFGSAKRARSGRNGNYVNYNSMSDRSRRPTGRPARAGYTFDDIVVDSRGEAEKVLDIMNEVIDRCGEVTVAEFYELVGVTGNGYTDRSYGWKDLRNAYVQRTREGYLFQLPRAVELE